MGSSESLGASKEFFSNSTTESGILASGPYPSTRKKTLISDRSTYTASPLSPNDLQITLEIIASRTELGDLWLDLEKRSDCSFFQSWAWIGCWLSQLPEGLNPGALVVSAGSNVIGLGVLIANHQKRHGLISSNALCLNETGNTSIDPIGLEYNGFLIDCRFFEPVVRRCIEWLCNEKHSWEELNFGGLDLANMETYAKIAEELGLAVVVRRKSRCDYVDLEEVRQDARGYLDMLSRNTRQQVRRALRLYEDHSPAYLEVARTREEALGILDELKELHQGYWTQRGHPGAFASDFFVHFHRDLVANRFDAGEIQLLRISAGEKLIGCLYNFVKDGWVYAYQSGFSYDADPRLKPGLVSHYLAIEHNLVQRASTYDFMAGDRQHKRSLGTKAGELTWLVLQRPRAKFGLEYALRSLKARLGHAGQSWK